MRAAAEADLDHRRILTDEAEWRLTRALSVQPASGSWWTWLAYARSLRTGDAAGVVDALTHSYQAAPFLAEEGPWRARTAALNWDRLGRPTQAHLIDEVIWMRDVDVDGFASVVPSFSDPAAARALVAGLSRPPAQLVPHRRSGTPGGVGAAS